MLDNSLKHVLDDKKISEALITHSVEKLSQNKRLYLISDHCDCRKEYSSKLESLGKVRSLSGQIVNGYSTLNTIIIDENRQNLTLSNITPFSNKSASFLSKSELRSYDNGSLKNEKRRAEIASLIESESYSNMATILTTHLEDQSSALKEANPDISLCHVHDRGCDDVAYFEFITNTLDDDFVVRLKGNRNSTQKRVNPKTKRENAVKVVDSLFKNEKVYLIDKMTYKGKCYQQVTCRIEWDTLTLNENEYTIIRSTLHKRDGKKIHKDPLVLITSLPVTNYIEAKEIYHIYLLRAKIEEVFKFLKNVLGWEEFQVRDWESIKNIIAICFFVGGFFYEIDSELTKNKTVKMICDLARSKGKITRYFFLEGIKMMLIAQQVTQFRIDKNISQKLYSEMLEYAGVYEDV